MVYNFHEDPGHGWLEVPYADIESVGAQGIISKFSYRKNNTCYLEEDCDAPRFEHAYELKNNNEKIDVAIVRHDGPGECFIRRLPRYMQNFK
jgi:hypothetical protein